MTDRSEASDPGHARSRLSVIVALVVVVGLCALLAWWLKPPPEAVAPAPTVQAPLETTPVSPPPRSSTPAAAPAERARRPESRPETKNQPATPAPNAAAHPSLRVTSDVAGAFVFVDRKYLGKTPLDTSDVEPGSHHLQVSAEGYDGASQSIEIAAAGPTDVAVSLKTVALNATVPVVHKHRFGSCEGTLAADVRGLRYQTANRDDAWTLTFGDLEKFALDYQSKTLQIRQRGGRTWNFTTRASNADPLLVFQREVDHARSRLTPTQD